MDYFEKLKMMKNEKPIEVGDTIVAQGIRATIECLYYFDRYVEEKNGKYEIFYDVEFKDTKGIHRHWKSYFDGGYVEFTSLL